MSRLLIEEVDHLGRLDTYVEEEIKDFVDESELFILNKPERMMIFRNGGGGCRHRAEVWPAGSKGLVGKAIFVYWISVIA